MKGDYLMFKYELKYEDFLGNEKTEVLRFNLSENEVMKLVKDDQIFTIEFLAYVADGKDPVTMFNVVSRIILAAYGELSDDGKIFRKSDQIRKDFEQSAMYDKFIEDMFGSNDTQKFVNFLVGIFPKKYADSLTEKINGEIRANGLMPVK